MGLDLYIPLGVVLKPYCVSDSRWACWPHPRISNLISLKWDLNIFNSNWNSNQLMLMLMVWRSHFENHYSVATANWLCSSKDKIHVHPSNVLPDTYRQKNPALWQVLWEEMVILVFWIYASSHPRTSLMRESPDPFVKGPWSVAMDVYYTV